MERNFFFPRRDTKKTVLLSVISRPEAIGKKALADINSREGRGDACSEQQWTVGIILANILGH